MPALADIRAALAGMGSIPHGTRRVVLIGKEAMRAVRTDFLNGSEPKIIDGAEVELTDNFPGWDIVDREQKREPLFKRGRHG